MLPPRRPPNPTTTTPHAWRWCAFRQRCAASGADAGFRALRLLHTRRGACRLQGACGGFCLGAERGRVHPRLMTVLHPVRTRMHAHAGLWPLYTGADQRPSFSFWFCASAVCCASRRALNPEQCVHVLASLSAQRVMTRAANAAVWRVAGWRPLCTRAHRCGCAHGRAFDQLLLLPACRRSPRTFARRRVRGTFSPRLHPPDALLLCQRPAARRHVNIPSRQCVGRGGRVSWRARWRFLQLPPAPTQRVESGAAAALVTVIFHALFPLSQ